MEQPLAFVIEDNSDLALVFSEAMVAAGYRVETFENGEDAMRRLELIAPAMIVLDFHLPGVTGPEILKYLHYSERFWQTRIIIASADEHLAKQYRSWVTLVLLKPISMVQLRDLAQRYLKPAQAAD